MVFYKAVKTIDLKDVEISRLHRENRRLTFEIENLKPKNKVKVVFNVGQRFV